ncbi:hypothetical protein [Candidatus Palauibacter sp.]|uniref:hypothetical protein n=1 Tax=Candidatus Palauibacter sp. TaxID=3101350 RepID=UPI003B5B115B
MALEYTCEDCERTFVRPGWMGPGPRVCKGCQNKRYLARLGPEGRARLYERKRLRAKASRLRERIRLARGELQSVEARLEAL